LRHVRIFDFNSFFALYLQMLDSQSSQLILLGKSPFSLLHSERRSAALIELRLLCALSFVSAPSRYEIRRADQLVQVDYMPVVELDIRASKTDDLREWSGTNLELKSCFSGEERCYGSIGEPAEPEPMS
jgi:hypothetical protein